MRFLIIISIIFHSGCESNRFENWNEMKNKIINQETEIDSLKNLASSRLEKFYQLESRVDYIHNKIKSEKKQLNSQVESHLFLVPFISEMDKVDLSSFLPENEVLYEVELVNVENLKHAQIDPNIDFQLTLSTKSLNSDDVYQNGLISYYQYSQPQKGIINSTSSKLLVDKENPYVFLEGNRQYAISGKLVLKISGKF